MLLSLPVACSFASYLLCRSWFCCFGFVPSPDFRLISVSRPCSRCCSFASLRVYSAMSLATWRSFFCALRYACDTAGVYHATRGQSPLALSTSPLTSPAHLALALFLLPWVFFTLVTILLLHLFSGCFVSPFFCYFVQVFFK